MLTDGVGPAVYVLALVNLSINRFLLSALSRVAAAHGRRPAAAHRELADPDPRARRPRASAGRSGSCSAWCCPPGAAGTRPPCSSRRRSWRPRPRWPPGWARTGWVPTSAPTPRQLRAALVAASRAGWSPARRHLVERRTPARALGIMAAHRFLYGVTFIASILIARNLLSDPADADEGLRDVRAGAGGVGGRVRPGGRAHAGALAAHRAARVDRALPERGRGQPAPARGVGDQGRGARRRRVPRASPPRAPRSRSTRSCSATPTTPSAAGRSRSTTSSTTPRSSAPPPSGAVTLPDDGYSRGLFLVLAVAYAGFAALYGTTSRGVPAAHARAEARWAS